MHDLDRTLRSQEPESEGDFEAAIFGESESEFEGETYVISEGDEIDLANELLAVSDDRELDQFLGGLLKYSRELCYFFAPTINAYKRFQPGSWAPTKLAWAHDNRTVGFRVVGHSNSFRIGANIYQLIISFF